MNEIHLILKCEELQIPRQTRKRTDSEIGAGNNRLKKF